MHLSLATRRCHNRLASPRCFSVNVCQPRSPDFPFNDGAPVDYLMDILRLLRLSDFGERQSILGQNRMSRKLPPREPIRGRSVFRMVDSSVRLFDRWSIPKDCQNGKPLQSGPILDPVLRIIGFPFGTQATSAVGRASAEVWFHWRPDSEDSWRLRHWLWHRLASGSPAR